MCELAGTTPEHIADRDMFGGLRMGYGNRLCIARSACVSALRELCDMSYPDAARAIGYKTQSSARVAIQQPCDRREELYKKAVSLWNQ